MTDVSGSFAPSFASPPSAGFEHTLVEHLPDLRRVVRTLGRLHRLTDDEQGDLLGEVLVRLVADGYAILRKYRGQSGLTTYLRTVAYRVLLDSRIKRWGKWRPSSRARALGDPAVRLERMVARDGFSASEALAILEQQPCLSLERGLASVLAAAAVRRPRRREVPLEFASHVRVDAVQHQAVESHGSSHDAARVCGAVRQAMRKLNADDCRLLHQRFAQGLSVAELARSTGADQKRLYRRFTRILRRLRTHLECADVGRDAVRSVVGHPDVRVTGLFPPLSPSL